MATNLVVLHFLFLSGRRCPKSLSTLATVADFVAVVSPFSATVALFCDSVEIGASVDRGLNMALLFQFSNRIVMKFDMIVPQVKYTGTHRICHRLTGSEFRFDVSLSSWRLSRLFTQKSAATG